MELKRCILSFATNYFNTIYKFPTLEEYLTYWIYEFYTHTYMGEVT